MLYFLFINRKSAPIPPPPPPPPQSQSFQMHGSHTTDRRRRHRSDARSLSTRGTSSYQQPPHFSQLGTRTHNDSSSYF